MNTVKLVNSLIDVLRSESEEHKEACALGATSALLIGAIDIMRDIINAYDHENPIEIVASMRYPVKDCKTFIKYIEERANV